MILWMQKRMTKTIISKNYIIWYYFIRNMLKAGEIRFCSRVNTKKKQGNHNMNPDSTPFCAAVGGSSQTSSLATISNTLSGSIHEGKQPPTCLSNNSLVKSMSTRMANLNLSFLGSLQPKGTIIFGIIISFRQTTQSFIWKFE